VIKYRDLNDHEIIYLIVEGDEDAFALMVEKYKPLIYRIIYHFRLSYMLDDIYQESVITLHKSVFAYDASFNKTFTRFLELNLSRMMMSQIQRLRRHSETLFLNEKPLAQRFHAQCEHSPYFDLYMGDIKKALTSIEYKAFLRRDIQLRSIEKIAQELDCGVHSVYNALHRARLKVKQLFPDELDKDLAI
jgi:RNA polymerase sigma factor (sigma-70 family)